MKDEMTRQLEMAWKRGRDFGLLIGISGAIIWSLFVVALLILKVI